MAEGLHSNGTTGLCFIMSLVALSRSPGTFNSWLKWTESVSRICPSLLGLLIRHYCKAGSVLWALSHRFPSSLCNKPSYSSSLLRSEVSCDFLPPLSFRLSHFFFQVFPVLLQVIFCILVLYSLTQFVAQLLLCFLMSQRVCVKFTWWL